MNKVSILYLLILILFLKNVDSQSNIIQNCEVYGKSADSNTCSKCKNNHFLFFHNFYCLPCDDELYGQVGCGGKCNNSHIMKNRMVDCDTCKEGYIKEKGICIPCSNYGCKNCIYNQDNELECTECISKEYFYENKKCEKCEMDKCIECHFVDGKNITVLLLLGNIPKWHEIDFWFYLALFYNPLKRDCGLQFWL